jgi:pilus assembly protein Flp/PilA
VLPQPSLAICSRFRRLPLFKFDSKQDNMTEFFRKIWSRQQGQDVAEYAVMMAIILGLAVGTVRLIGTNANTTFSSIGSTIQ